MTAISTFKAKAPTYMRLLMRDFGFSALDAAAIMGNAGHESGGLTIFQELHPTSGRGGFGWFQWTGSRRVKFEAYCKKMGLSTKSDTANYGFLVVELRGPEKAAVNKTKQATTLNAKVRAFENAFERAGVKNYGSRELWAARAMSAWNASPLDKTPPPPDLAPPVAEPATKSPVPTDAGGAAIGVGAGASVHWWLGFDPWLAALLGVTVAIVIILIVHAAKD